MENENNLLKKINIAILISCICEIVLIILLEAVYATVWYNIFACIFLIFVFLDAIYMTKKGNENNKKDIRYNLVLTVLLFLFVLVFLTMYTANIYMN